jgi:hypothetical protein
MPTHAEVLKNAVTQQGGLFSTPLFIHRRDACPGDFNKMF